MPAAPNADIVQTLDDTVRQAAPDRWLASRFIDDAQARADVVALYAFDHELARAPLVASEPLLAEIRLTWWSEALDEMFAGRPVRVHPAAQGLAAAVGRGRLERGLLDGLIQARMDDAYQTPFAGEGDLFAYLDAAPVALMRAAAALLGEASDLHTFQAAGRAWGLGLLTRARSQGAPSRLPESLGEDRLRALTAQAVRAARQALKMLPVAQFPAVSYACLARTYAKGRLPGLLEKQARLVWATARGRI